MQLLFLGTGSANCDYTYNWHSNLLISRNNKNLLIDCGGDARHALRQQGYSHNDLDAIYISHLHHDHVGGLENVAQVTMFTPGKEKVKLFAEGGLTTEIWEKSLEGGLEGLEGKRYLAGEKFVSLGTYFDLNPISRNSGFEWEGIHFDMVQTTHVTAKYMTCSSYGLMWNDPDVGTRYFMTTDTQFSPESTMTAYYDEADVIFHDCETHEGFMSGVHAHFDDLSTFSDEIKSKMWLYHAQDNVWSNFAEWNEKAKAAGFKGFLPRGATFNGTHEDFLSSVQKIGVIP